MQYRIALGYGIAAWGALFAAVHFYWAAGGTAIVTGDESGGAGGWAAAYIAFIAVLGLVAGVVGLALGREAPSPVSRRTLVRVARLGAALLLFGVAIAAVRLAAGTDDDWSRDPVATATITLYFLLGGVLLALAARAGASK
jgi:hypothetical protein